METELEKLRREKSLLKNENFILRDQMNFIFKKMNLLLRDIYLELKKGKYENDYDELIKTVSSNVVKFDMELIRVEKETKERLEKLPKEKDLERYTI